MGRFMHCVLTCSGECVGGGLLLAVMKPPVPDNGLVNGLQLSCIA